jgi:hypothetical protein
VEATRSKRPCAVQSTMRYTNLSKTERGTEVQPF